MQSKTYDVYDRLNPPVEEAFKVLRTNLLFSNADKKFKSLAIVSCLPKEGKTTVAINLSISVARSGLRVLLVDADLRKPMLIKRLGGPDFPGLSSALMGVSSLADVICNTSIENLFYVSCGPKQSNPSELLGSFEFTRFLQTVEDLYDMVIFDTSTLGSVIDAAIIASQTGGTLMVVASRTVTPDKAIRMKEQLEKANANLLGAVLNKVNKDDFKKYNGHYNSFYYFNKSGVVGKFDKGRFWRVKKNEVKKSD